jgi:hypothetical protein
MLADLIAILIVLALYCGASVVYFVTHAFGPTPPNAFMMFPIKVFLKLVGKK